MYLPVCATQPAALEGVVEPAVVDAAATANAALEDSAGVKATFSITVCARFRPAATRLLGVKPAAVVLQLHQRVQLIKASCKGGCTTREAFRQIMREQGRTIAEGESLCVLPRTQGHTQTSQSGRQVRPTTVTFAGSLLQTHGAMRLCDTYLRMRARRK